MLNLKSQLGKGVTALTVALSMTVAGVGMLALDAGPAFAKHGKKTTKTSQKATAKNNASNDQNAEANSGRCINVSPAVGGVSIAPAVVVLGITLFSIPIAAANAPTGNGNQSCNGGGAVNNNTNNQGSIAANNDTTNADN